MLERFAAGQVVRMTVPRQWQGGKERLREGEGEKQEGRVGRRKRDTERVSRKGKALVK